VAQAAASGTQVLAEHRGGVAQDVVTAPVAVRVVDRLEVVDVDDRHADRQPAAPRAGGELGEAAGEAVAVRQPGERVRPGGAPVLAVGVGQRAHHDRDHHERDGVRREHRRFAHHLAGAGAERHAGETDLDAGQHHEPRPARQVPGGHDDRHHEQDGQGAALGPPDSTHATATMSAPNTIPGRDACQRRNGGTSGRRR
jgi:hypothetical protein